MNVNISPCMRCTRVPDPRQCDNKDCGPWRQWFKAKWEDMRFSVRAQMEKVEQKPIGLPIGGVYYPQPHRLRGYLRKDPCDGCLCPKDLCVLPCAVKRSWLQARQDTLM